MSRLYDRVLGFGCERLRPYHLATETQEEDLRLHTVEAFRERVLTEEGLRNKLDTEEKVEAWTAYAGSQQARVAHQPIATEKFDASELEGVPVIAGDEVAAYCADLPTGTDIGDVVTALAPPFDRFFVDIQGADNPFGLNAWCLLVEDMGDLGGEGLGWHLTLTLIIEPEKNDPIGQVARFFLGLDHEGYWFRGPEDGQLLWQGKLVEFEPRPPLEIEQESLDMLVPLVLPALMTVSFMHCKNVTAEPFEPPEGSSKSWRKKRGRPLTRYHVLEIAPMRRILDSEGQAQRKGLGHALGICRGHFKSFTEEAPLFGRHTGQFWWASHVRGSEEHGTVSKDYSVRLDRPGFGRPYREADETPDLARPERAGPDPDIAGRGLQAHNITQNHLAAILREAGLKPRSPGSDEPNYDLAWEASEQTWVAEVKSITAANEERQLRLAIGQVVRYRHQLAAAGRDVQAVVAVERKPTDETWLDLCNEQSIILTWPETMGMAVASSMS